MCERPKREGTSTRAQARHCLDPSEVRRSETSPWVRDVFYNMAFCSLLRLMAGKEALCPLSWGLPPCGSWQVKRERSTQDERFHER